jgi:hypothetical protein
LQQLPRGFDAGRLHMGSLEARMDKYMSTVQSLITADDELLSSMEGLEILLLIGVYHINGGNPRRAWLTYRRALSIGQILGIHRSNETNSATNPGGRAMWHQIVQGDRYLVSFGKLFSLHSLLIVCQALLLGLPAGSPSSDSDFLPHETFQNPEIDKSDLFKRKLSSISVRIIDRNSDTTHTFATTQEIDEQLEQLSKEMPTSWYVTGLVH